jgi:hypothetical protein
MNFEVVNPWPY